MKAMNDGVNDAELGYEEDFDTFAGGLTPEKPAEAKAGDGMRTMEGDAETDDKFVKAFDSATKEKQTFKQAFADARKEGVKTFEWNGKKYTTDLAKPTAKPKMTGTKDPLPASTSNKRVARDMPGASGEKKGSGMGPKLTMLPKDGAKSIYDERKPVQQAGSGLEKQIPV